MENPIKMDDLGVPLFLETPMYSLPFITYPFGGYPTYGSCKTLFWMIRKWTRNHCSSETGTNG